MNFRYRLALFLVVTLVIIQGLAAAVVYGYLRHSLVEKEKSELIRAAHVFTRQLALLSDGVAADVKVLSLDFALRQAIAQRDERTEISALRNHGRRVGATRMMLVGLDGTITSDTSPQAREGGTFAYRDLLTGAAFSDERTALATSNGHVHWVVVVPVRAPLPIAFIAAFIPVDAALLEKLRQISAVPRSITLASGDSRGGWTIDANTGGPVALMPTSSRYPPFETASIVQSGEKQYLTVATRLSTSADSAPVVAVLGYPLDEALAPYRSTIWPMLGVLAASLLAALAGAMVIVRSVSRPVEALARSARRIAAGDYTTPEPLAQRGELRHLSETLVSMTHAIAQREEAMRRAIAVAEVARSDAEQANRAKLNFLANMSHELRTPLNAVVGFGEMIQHQVLGPIGVSRYADYAADIGRSAQHLLGLVSRMLDMADIENGRMGVAKDAFDICDALKQSLEIARPVAQKAGVTLSIDGDLSVATRVAGDCDRLRQALSGLLDNAIRFTPAGGSVIVSTSIESDGFNVEIRDTGVGMKDEDLAIVTRPFHRLRSAFDGLQQGAGLGLPFAKSIIELYGGRFVLESAPHEGTTVRVVLPLLAQATANAA
jgi:signal transduction histidine kinase